VLEVEEYKQRLKDRESRVADRERIHARLGYVRLLLALVAAAIAWKSLWRSGLSPWWITAPLILIVFVAAIHSRILRFRDLAQTGVPFYQKGLARIEDRWAGTGQPGDRFNNPHHAYAGDLDLFLFELLSTARTRMGEETLAGWLLSPSGGPDWRAACCDCRTAEASRSPGGLGNTRRNCQWDYLIETFLAYRLRKAIRRTPAWLRTSVW
jgi:hypothetical protein